MTARELDQA